MQPFGSGIVSKILIDDIIKWVSDDIIDDNDDIIKWVSEFLTDPV
jgi:hypothetical protein